MGELMVLEGDDLEMFNDVCKSVAVQIAGLAYVMSELDAATRASQDARMALQIVLEAAEQIQSELCRLAESEEIRSLLEFDPEADA